MVISPSGGSNGVGCITVVGYICLLPPEHSCTFHCNRSYYGSVSGGGEASRVTGNQAVVGSGRIVPGRGADSVLGGGMGGGGGGDKQGGKGDVQTII